MAYLYSRTKYLCATPHDARATLEKYGVAIIPNILTPDELAAMNTGIWDTLEHLSSEWPEEKCISRSNPASYNNVSELYPSHGMLFQHHGISHAKYVWDVRQNPSVVKAFAALWKCDMRALHTSFDAVSFAVPPELRPNNAGFHTKDWLHSDQSFTNSSFACVQGFVNGYDVHPGDATLVVLEGSHLHHKDFAATLPNPVSKDDWFQLLAGKDGTPNHVKWYTARGCPRVSIRALAGDLVLWDSRTIHCGQAPIRGRAHPSTFRHVVYVCMTPKDKTPISRLSARRNAFDNLRTTTHWPMKARLFAKLPNTWGKKSTLPHKPLPRPTLTSLGNSLKA